MLSATHKVFDPFGFVSPVMLCPKLMLQKTSKLSLGWDEEITGSLREEFFQWFRKLEALKEVRVSRRINITPDATKKLFTRTFCDASKDAYAAVSYLVQEADDKNAHFLASSPNRSFEGCNDTEIRTTRCIGESEINKIHSRCPWLDDC
ncbi:hypothetical protein AVEN_152237-1 [Araneus ventricosus]|uniref:Reverse transcriptase/retrotransposon-derived protein RNase H-like domain-containing protein n=1 Tax=Araneus ventricosus TaxID=182803 RepID=A0A4Y2KCK9_ARAVE|nr:hypothetical protein AVEN_152237-1 [Araneus ventricosus]